MPGQSLQENVVHLMYDYALPFTLLAILPWSLAFIEWMRYVKPSPPRPWPFTIIACICSAYAIYRLFKLIPEIRNRNRGLSGELVVGQILERLRANGFEVFHDILGDGFNIDHVLIGPQGIFTVETKTIGKPHRGKAIVEYDGQKIQMNGVMLTRNPVDQAKAQSAWLAKLIQERSGKRQFVKPIVVFPGWYVQEKIKDPPVLVLNDQRITPYVLARESRLNESDIKLISAQLNQYIMSVHSDTN
jgi:hypothetical protein